MVSGQTNRLPRTPARPSARNRQGAGTHMCVRHTQLLLVLYNLLYNGSVGTLLSMHLLQQQAQYMELLGSLPMLQGGCQPAGWLDIQLHAKVS